MTGILGAIDCTHVAILAPSDDEFHLEKNYINRKGFHSINVQLVSISYNLHTSLFFILKH